MQNKDICQQTKNKPIIAAFDFDGTMTTRDSLPLFLSYTSGVLKTGMTLARHIPKFITCLCGLISRQQVKESILKSFFKGMPIDDLRKKGADFAKGPLLSIMRPKALACLDHHLKNGHRCILVSANLDVYLEPFAKNHGFSDCLCSKLGYNDNNLVTGYLQGLNCIGPEKVDRLTALLGPKENYTLYAYGDSAGDRQLLDFADHSFYRPFT